jgi:NitT/TauT family transport system substrate-binding protein
MRTNRWTRSLGILLAISMLAFGMETSAQAARPHAGMVNVTLVLKWVPQAQFAGYFIAKDKGYYAQQGLNVTIKPGGPEVTPETVVAGGGAQFGIDWLSALLHARDTGVPIVNIAQIFQASGMRIIDFKRSGINSIYKFSGHTVGVWFAGNEYQFFALEHKYHLTNIKVVSQPFVMTPFLTGHMEIAHAMTYNELGVVLEHGVSRSQLNIFDYNKLGVSILEDGIFATSSYLKSHGDVAVKFLRASIRGWQYAVAHPNEAGAISYSHAPAGTTTLFHQKYMARQVARLIEYGPGLSHTIGYMSPVLFRRTWTTLLQQKVIHHAPSGAYTQVYWRRAGGH